VHPVPNDVLEGELNDALGPPLSLFSMIGKNLESALVYRQYDRNI
jgi:hypothetical protein